MTAFLKSSKRWSFLLPAPAASIPPRSPTPAPKSACDGRPCDTCTDAAAFASLCALSSGLQVAERCLFGTPIACVFILEDCQRIYEKISSSGPVGTGGQIEGLDLELQAARSGAKTMHSHSTITFSNPQFSWTRHQPPLPPHFDAHHLPFFPSSSSPPASYLFLPTSPPSHQMPRHSFVPLSYFSPFPTAWTPSCPHPTLTLSANTHRLSCTSHQPPIPRSAAQLASYTSYVATLFGTRTVAQQ